MRTVKEILSIGEFAKSRKITAETLRHYDRIGLLKPIKVDSETGYRYYSVLQYEKLGTILELRQLGMSIDEIKKYFDNRNLKQSVEILRSKHEDLKEKIEELKALELSIGEKIDHLEEISKASEYEGIFMKKVSGREIITFNRDIKNEVDLGHASLELENSLKEIAPIVASNRYGALIKKENIEEKGSLESVDVFLFIRDRKGLDEKHIVKIPQGTYACMYYRGGIWDRDQYLEKMLGYLKENAYEIVGDILQILQIDISVTDQSEEVLFEIQIPVKKLVDRC